MIVKLQRALAPSTAPVLAYNERRAWQKFLPLTPELAALFGNKVKIFADIEIVGEDMIIEKIVPDRAW
jgi:hypothetical protein